MWTPSLSVARRQSSRCRHQLAHWVESPLSVCWRKRQGKVDCVTSFIDVVKDTCVLYTCTLGFTAFMAGRVNGVGDRHGCEKEGESRDDIAVFIV